MISKKILVGVILGVSTVTGILHAQTSDLVSRAAFRVCSDPANLPQSAKSGDGYENKIAQLLADTLGLPLEYTWFPMSTGFIRNTLGAYKCDVVIAYSAGHELVLNTNPYYSSTYVLVSRKESTWQQVDRLSDPILAKARIGVVAGTAPASHLAAYGYAKNMEPYHLFVDRRHDSPSDNMLADIVSGAVDVGVLWGPIGGPLVKQKYADLQAVPLLHEQGNPRLVYRITMGVRRGEIQWKRRLNSLIRRNQHAIDTILHTSGVPLVNDAGDALKEIE